MIRIKGVWSVGSKGGGGEPQVFVTFSLRNHVFLEKNLLLHSSQFTLPS